MVMYNDADILSASCLILPLLNILQDIVLLEQWYMQYLLRCGKTVFVQGHASSADYRNMKCSFPVDLQPSRHYQP